MYDYIMFNVGVPTSDLVVYGVALNGVGRARPDSRRGSCKYVRNVFGLMGSL